MDKIITRFAIPGDETTLATLIDAMDRYYGDPEKPDGETCKAVAGWLQGGVSDARFVLALHGEDPVGFASAAVVYPGTALKGMMFLKDVFVAEEWRSQRVGEHIMKFLARFCERHEIDRIDWTTETDQAQRFYERLGAETRPQKRPMRLAGDAISSLAKD